MIKSAKLVRMVEVLNLIVPTQIWMTVDEYDFSELALLECISLTSSFFS